MAANSSTSATKKATDDDLQSQVETLKGDLGAVRGDLSNIAKLLMDQGKAKAGDAKDDVEERLRATVDQGREYAQRGREVVESRPLTSAAAAFGIGILAGIFISRK